MVWQSHRVGRVCAAHAPAPHDDAGARRSGARRLVGTSRRGQPRPGGPSPPPPSRSLPRAPPRRPWYRHPTPKPPPSGRDAMRVTRCLVAAAADTAAVARPHARARGCRPCMERLMASQPAPARARGGRARVPRGGSGFPPSSAAGGWGAAPASHRRGLLLVHSPRRCAGASPPEGVWRQHPRGGGGCTVARGAAALLAKSGQAAPGWGLPPVPSGGGVARPDGCAAAAVPRASAPRTPRLSPPLPATPPIHQQSSLCTSARRAAVGGTVAPGRAARPAPNAGGSARGGAIRRRPMASRRTPGGGPWQPPNVRRGSFFPLRGDHPASVPRRRCTPRVV